VPAAAVTVKVEDPLPVTDGGLNVALAPPGRPLTVNPTLSVNPLSAETLIVYAPLPPVAVDNVAGAAVTEKSGVVLPPLNVAACNVTFPTVALACVKVSVNVCPLEPAL
jgi:hypothetical protein